MTSVIVPVYNAQRFLEDAIQSILSQTVPDMEIILVNDGSTDDSLSICEKFAQSDPRIKVVTTPNQGLSMARNTGLDICKGETITFVDADDAIHPRFLETLLPYCSGKGEVAIALQSANPKILSDNISPDAKVETWTGLKAAELSLYQQRVINSACGKIFSRDLFFDPHRRFRKGIYFEDLEISTPLFCHATRVSLIHTPLYFYRENPHSFLHGDSDARADCLTVTADTVEWVKQNQPELLPAAISRQISASLHIFKWVNSRRPDLKPVADSCFATIKKHRRQLLSNPNVRLKNKIALLASFTGQTAMSKICKLS